MNVIWLDRAPEDALPEVARVSGPAGEMLAIWDEEARGHLMFVEDEQSLQHRLDSIAHRWGRAPVWIAGDDPRVTALTGWLHTSPLDYVPPPLPLQVVGTPFQQAVWGLLLRSRPGQTLSYGQIADRLSLPGAARAVGGAVGANPLAIAIPCHRVVPAHGGLGGYRWGQAHKARLLALEGAVSELSPDYPDAGSGGG